MISIIYNVVKWFNNNRLHVNSSKSSCMRLTTKSNVRDLEININGTNVNTESNMKYLGVNITDKLCWNTHISQICKKTRL